MNEPRAKFKQPRPIKSRPGEPESISPSFLKKKKAMESKAPPKAKGNPNMKKGGPSINPAGRPKGIKNYANRLTNEERQLIAEMNGGLTPLQYMMSIVRAHDSTISLDARLEAAKAVAPYLHRKMPMAIEGGDPSKPISILDVAALKNLSTKEIDQLLALLAKAGAQIE